MKEDCIYCDRLFEERDLVTCSDCDALGCSSCINEKHCCNGLPDEDFYDDGEFIYDEEDEETEDN